MKGGEESMDDTWDFVKQYHLHVAGWRGRGEGKRAEGMRRRGQRVTAHERDQVTYSIISVSQKRNNYK